MKNITNDIHWRNFKGRIKRSGMGSKDPTYTIMSQMASYIEALEWQILDLDRRLNDISRREDKKEDDLH